MALGHTTVRRLTFDTEFELSRQGVSGTSLTPYESRVLFHVQRLAMLSGHQIAYRRDGSTAPSEASNAEMASKQSFLLAGQNWPDFAKIRQC